ncbi:hypothetical protein VNO77_20310 [Canavalia gladiata]|uniref:DNA-directed RNA polymerase III subunit RPC10 n=1 Tax=Canavalia gladiata TaxID=3824 RepID=A0AAN9QLB5_CANGL
MVPSFLFQKLPKEFSSADTDENLDEESQITLNYDASTIDDYRLYSIPKEWHLFFFSSLGENDDTNILHSVLLKMEFCPTCGNMLQYELPDLGRPSRFFCAACPYVCHIENRVKIKRKQRLVRKEIEPVISPDDMKNAPKTEEPCPRCNNPENAYTEFQTRSADEPATIFYLCLNGKCRHQWRRD